MYKTIFSDGYSADVEEDITEELSLVAKQTSVHNLTIHLGVEDNITKISTL